MSARPSRAMGTITRFTIIRLLEAPTLVFKVCGVHLQINI